MANSADGSSFSLESLSSTAAATYSAQVAFVTADTAQAVAANAAQPLMQYQTLPPMVILQLTMVMEP